MTRPFFEPPAMLENPVAIEKVALEEAEGIVCTGPFDPHADPGHAARSSCWPRRRA
jgi:hypothetical protein